MAIFDTDLTSELDQIKGACADVIEGQLSPMIENAISKAGKEMNLVVTTAGIEIKDSIKILSDELHNQRKLTTDDIKELIDYSAENFGKAIDVRIEKLKNESAALVTDKINEFRLQLSDSVNEQKRSAIRNSTISVASAIFIGLISLFYKKVLHGDIDLISVFRIFLLAFAGGHAIWFVLKLLTGYLQESKAKRSLILVGAQYFGIFRVRGTLAHVLLFIFVVALWAALNFWPQIKGILL